VKSSQSTVNLVSTTEANASPGAPANPKGLSLRANFSWTFLGNVVYAASQWGMLVVLAKLGSPELVGLFALALAICSPIVIFTNLQLRNVQATDVRRGYLFGDYFGLRLVTISVALLIVLAVMVLSRDTVSQGLVIFFMGVAKSIEAVSDVFYGMFQQHERFDRIAKSMMIKGPLSLLVFGALVYWTGNVLWGVVGLALSWAVVLTYDVRSGIMILDAEPEVSGEPGIRAVHPRWRAVKLKELALATLPLGLTALLITLNPNIPRYFVQWTLGERELGIYAALAYLVVAGNTVVGALGQSATPRLARYYSHGASNAFRGLLLRLVGVGGLLGGAGILIALLAGRPVLLLLYSAEYAEHSDVFVWIMVAVGIGYVAAFLNCGLMAARYFKAQLPLFMLVTSVTAAACAWLVPQVGLLGAAWALALSLTVQALGTLLVNWYALRHHHAEPPANESRSY
jgi:O-antigen/teichoic acid export membrane protein